MLSAELYGEHCAYKFLLIVNHFPGVLQELQQRRLGHAPDAAATVCVLLEKRLVNSAIFCVLNLYLWQVLSPLENSQFRSVKRFVPLAQVLLKDSDPNQKRQVLQHQANRILDCRVQNWDIMLAKMLLDFRKEHSQKVL